MLDAKPLHKSMLICQQLDPEEQIKVEITM